jgi:hypothetical protein
MGSNGVFSNHIVICGWNYRAPRMISTLRDLTRRSIVILTEDIDKPIQAVGAVQNVYIVAGDPCNSESLEHAEVGSAKSVLVLRDDTLGASADAQSVKIALAVERIQVEVHTVVELLDSRNRDHFSWTKVDEVVSEDDIAVKLIAQAVRHSISKAETHEGVSQRDNERLVTSLYTRMIAPSDKGSQIFRVDAPWEGVRTLHFGNILERGVRIGVVPVAIVGYRKHLIQARPGIPEWTSWKSDVWTTPRPGVTFEEHWPQWPGKEELGILVLAQSMVVALKLV